MENKSKKKLWIILIIAAVVVLAPVLYFALSPKEVYYTTKPATSGSIETTVMATGYVQPVDEIEVGTQVSGLIDEIFVDFNDVVKKGDLLALLDTSTLTETVTKAKASLASAESQLTYATLNYNRIEQLYNAKAATLVAYEEAKNTLDKANASYVEAQANLHQAEVNLGYARITSPIDGVILNREVEIGQTVAASFSTPTLFNIANDLTKMQVEADVDEADIGQVNEGQEVEFSVDSYPNDTFTGTVQQVRLQPTTTNNVVTYTVIIDAPNPDLKLLPGMTANITIMVDAEEGVLVPSEALSFKMPEDVQKRLGIGDNSDGATNVWVLNADHNPEQRVINVGTGDGVHNIARTGLNDGDQVILSASLEKKVIGDKKQATANPLMPQRRRR